MTQMQTANKVKIDDLGPTRKRMTITIGPEVIDEKLGTSMAALAADTVVPGFRKGRAPKQLLERRFGSAVRDEAKNQIIAQAYAAAVEEHKLKAIGEPEPAEDFDLESVKVEPGKPLTFAVDIEVAPEVTLPSLDGIELKKPTLEVTDQMINDELLSQRIRLGTPNEIKGDFKKGDRVACSAVATKKGEDEPFFRADTTVFVVPGSEDGGRGQVLGLMIDGLTGLLKGKKVGEDFTIQTKGPEAHEREDIRGADITIEMHIKEAVRVEPAEVAAVLEEYGIETEELLKEQIKLAIEQRRDLEVADALRTQVYDYLAEATDLPLPEKLSQAQAARSLENARLNLLQRGVSEDEVETRLAELRSASELDAKHRLKLFFVLHALAEKYEIRVSEPEINGRLAQMAASYGMRPDQLRNDLVQRGALSNVAMQIREQKAADRVVAQAKVEEISVKKWQEMVAEREQKNRDRMNNAGKSSSSSSSSSSKKSSDSGSKSAGAATASKPTTKKTTTKKTTTKKTTTKKTTSK